MVYFWAMEMYFIALVAPEEIDQQIVKWKNFMKEKFGCMVALRSPAHVTLIPPFWMKEEMENELIQSLNEFSAHQNQLMIQLKNFSSFKPGVLFVDVIKNEQLALLKTDLEDFLLGQKKFPIKKEERSFHAHITIATRDLYKKAFFEAWDIFQNKKYEAEWRAKGVSVLRHNKKNWDVIHTSQLNS